MRMATHHSLFTAIPSARHRAFIHSFSYGMWKAEPGAKFKVMGSLALSSGPQRRPAAVAHIS